MVRNKVCLALIDDQTNIYLSVNEIRVGDICKNYKELQNKLPYINKWGILFMIYEGKLSLSKDMLRHMPETISFFLHIYMYIFT